MHKGFLKTLVLLVAFLLFAIPLWVYMMQPRLLSFIEREATISGQALYVIGMFTLILAFIITPLHMALYNKDDMFDNGIKTIYRQMSFTFQKNSFFLLIAVMMFCCAAVMLHVSEFTFKGLIMASLIQFGWIFIWAVFYFIGAHIRYRLYNYMPREEAKTIFTR